MSCHKHILLSTSKVRSRAGSTLPSRHGPRRLSTARPRERVARTLRLLARGPGTAHSQCARCRPKTLAPRSARNSNQAHVTQTQHIDLDATRAHLQLRSIDWTEWISHYHTRHSHNIWDAEGLYHNMVCTGGPNRGALANALVRPSRINCPRAPCHTRALRCCPCHLRCCPHCRVAPSR